MSIKVLWVHEACMMPSQAHIIRHLYDNGMKVVTEEIPLDGPRWGRLVEHEVVDRHLAAHYDFHVIATHNGNPSVQRFQRAVRPRLGSFDLEHDLLHDYPERGPSATSLGTFAFTRKHERYLLREGRKPLVARWYKLDGPRIIGDAWNSIRPPDSFAPMSDAVVIGSELWHWKSFPWNKSFHHCWYKPYAPQDRTMVGTRRLPDAFANTQGVVDLARVSRFWFSYESSCLAEALLFDCIPVLCSPRIVERIPVNDVVDRVKIIARESGVGGEFVSLLAVTQDDFDRKVRTLYEPSRYDETLTILRNQFFEPDAWYLPTVHDTLLREMRYAYAAGQQGGIGERASHY